MTERFARPQILSVKLFMRFRWYLVGGGRLLSVLEFVGLFLIYVHIGPILHGAGIEICHIYERQFNERNLVRDIKYISH